MRVPSYRKHSSGQARVTINGKDHLLGKYGSPESKEAYGRLISEFAASNQSASFGKNREQLLMEDVLLAYLQHAMRYYRGSSEYANLKLVVRPLVDLYASLPASRFSPVEFKAVRQWWLSDKSRSRQYVNKQMKRTLRIIKWAVGEGMMPPECHFAIKCVEPLRKGRCEARESKPITCVDPKLVEATLPHLTNVVADMVRFQLFTGCRPGEVVVLKPCMVDRTGQVWTIKLENHKTAYRGRERTLYVGPRAQRVLRPYLLRSENSFCFSPLESEKQRRAILSAERVTPPSWGNRKGTNRARKPRKSPGEHYTTSSYGRAIKYACERAKLESWSPNRLRHNAATNIRKQFGLDAAQVILGHSEVGVTQVYAEADQLKAREVAMKIG